MLHSFLIISILRPHAKKLNMFMLLIWGHLHSGSTETLNALGFHGSECFAFPRKYQEGMKKDDYWAYALEDCLDVIATWRRKRCFLLDVYSYGSYCEHNLPLTGCMINYP